MQALKIAVIGGGSSYTPELIEGIIVRYEQLPVTELALVDVESGREKVEIIAALTRRMLKHKGLEQVAVSVHFTLDEAIRGASFVLTQLRVGQLAARAASCPTRSWVSTKLAPRMASSSVKWTLTATCSSPLCFSIRRVSAAMISTFSRPDSTSTSASSVTGSCS